MHGVSLQPAGAATGGQLHAGNGGPGDPRPAQPAVPKLYPLPSEDTWFLCEQDVDQMRLPLAFLITVAAFAQQTAPPAQPAEKTPATESKQEAGTTAKADEQKPAEAAAAPAGDKAVSPAPSGEQWITGSF